MRKEILRMKRKLLSILVIVITYVVYYGCSSSTTCNKDSDCPSGQRCLNQKCYSGVITPDPTAIDPNTGCSKDSECGTCKRCDDGVCKPISDCDTGVVQIDGSRDIERGDAGDEVLDVTTDAGDAEDIFEDAGGDIEDGGNDITDVEEVVEPSDSGDTGDAGIDTSDISDISSCDAGGMLIVQRREPAGELPRGTLLTIRGQGFDGECGTLSVYFTGDSNPAKVVEVASGYIKVIVPGFAQSGDITVRSFGQEQKLTAGNAFKLQRRLFFTDYGNATNPGKKFFSLTFPNFLTYRNGMYDSDGSLPYPVLLDPYSLMILVISNDSSGVGYSISAYDFATIEFIKKVTNDQAKSNITSAILDAEKGRIYLTSLDGRLYVHEMETLALKEAKKIAVALYGIDIDKKNNRVFLSGTQDSAVPPPGGPPQDYRGAMFVLDRDTLNPIGDGYVLFGDKTSIAFDVKYHADTDRVFVVDYTSGNLYIFRAGDMSNDTAPISLGVDFGPVRLAFGKGFQRLYVIGNNSPGSPRSATATIKGFSTDTLTEISGSPLDTRLVTSTDSDNSKNLVNIVYDYLDGYLIATSNADNRFAVVIEDTFSLLTNPASPDNTKTPSSSGNFGIVVEDW